MFTINIAKLNIEINEAYENVKRLCSNYITESDHVDFSVFADEKSIDKEMTDSKNRFSRGYCESICIYREISKNLHNFDAFVMHGAVVELDGFSYAFLAKSGTGKSTHVNLWLEKYKDRAQIINGDKPIIRKLYGDFFACGTPWCGKENLGTNKISPLKAICFIERSSENKIRQLGISEVIDRIFHQLLVPESEPAQDKFFSLLDDFLQKTPAYLLSCNISVQAAELAYNTMK